MLARGLRSKPLQQTAPARRHEGQAKATMTTHEPKDKPPHPLDRAVFFRPFAHRGLHDASRGRIENTWPAFAAAIARGYGIECDLQAACDGTAMVFHDATLGRLLRARGRLDRRTPTELARLSFRGQTGGAPTAMLSFAELLARVEGRVPLLVEVKRARLAHERFLAHIAREARAHPGPVALMSFDAESVRALAQLAGDLPRGLVVDADQLPRAFRAAPATQSAAKAVAELLTSAGPVSFVSVGLTLLEAAHAWRARASPATALFCWTVRSEEDRALADRFADAPTFEGYLP